MSDGDLRTSRLVTEADRRPLLVALDDAAALDPALTGGKAAALARGRTAGLASLPGVVLTTGVLGRHRRWRRSRHACRRAGGIPAGGWRPHGARGA